EEEHPGRHGCIVLARRGARPPAACRTGRRGLVASISLGPGHADPQSLRKLLDAAVAISSGLDQPGLLRRSLETPTELPDGRYGPLGVLDETGSRLGQFLTVGVDDETHRAIGDLPSGHGILGLLIVDARPIRLPDLTEHPDSYGFPPHHPEMRSFLGVPLRVR